MSEYLQRLIEFDNFMPRSDCGDWLPWVVSVHYWGDVVFALIYLTVPFGLWYSRSCLGVPIYPTWWVDQIFRSIFTFIGLDHLCNVLAFHVGIYDQQAILKLGGAIFSLAAMLSFFEWLKTCKEQQLYCELGEVIADELSLSDRGHLLSHKLAQAALEKFRLQLQESRQYLNDIDKRRSQDRKDATIRQNELDRLRDKISMRQTEMDKRDLEAEQKKVAHEQECKQRQEQIDALDQRIAALRDELGDTDHG